MDHEKSPSKIPNSEENPWLIFSTREMPTSSPNPTCRFYIRAIERAGKMDQIAHFIDEKLAENPKTYQTTDDFFLDNPDYQVRTNAILTPAEKSAVLEYSGYRFAWINSVARGFWDYEKMGRKTPELATGIEDAIENVSQAIQHAPSFQTDLLTFRGTNLDGFKKYGVEKLSDLKNLEHQFYYEGGFTSTALLREKSFADRAVSDLWIGKSNVEIRYHLPADSSDALALLVSDLSYSPEQTEVLINRSSLSYVSSVNLEANRATVDMLLLPRSLYDN